MTDAERAGYRQALEDVEQRGGLLVVGVVAELRAALDAAPAAPPASPGECHTVNVDPRVYERSAAEIMKNPPKFPDLKRPASPGERGETPEWTIRELRRQLSNIASNGFSVMAVEAAKADLAARDTTIETLREQVNALIEAEELACREKERDAKTHHARSMWGACASTCGLLAAQVRKALAASTGTEPRRHE